MIERNLLQWSSRITDQMKRGDAKECLNILERMCHSGVDPDAYTISCCLNASNFLGDMEIGRIIHALFMLSVSNSSAYVNSTLISMYANWGYLEDARQVFEGISNQDVISCNAMITGYTKHGCAENAIDLYKFLSSNSIQPTAITFTSVLYACSKLENLECGRQVHNDILVRSIKPNMYIGNVLIDMYSKCGSIEDAWKVFDKMQDHDVISWNAMIAAMGKHGFLEKAFMLYEQMLHEGTHVNDRTLVSILSACKAGEYLDQGKQLHAVIEKSEYEANVIVRTTLMDMYTNCGNLKHAQAMFESIPKLDVVTWNVIITANVKHGYIKEAMELYDRMELQGVIPNEITFLSILHACGGLADVEQGRQTHASLIKIGINSSLPLSNGLIDMYMKCKTFLEACDIFDQLSHRDVVSWTAAITGYAQFEKQECSFGLFFQMQQESVLPNKVTFLALLTSINSPHNIKACYQLHCQIEASGMNDDLNLMNTILHTYANCGRLNEAQVMFGRMTKQDIVMWNALISGYAKYGHGEKAWELFSRMKDEALLANESTFMSVVEGISRKAALELGKQVHAIILGVNFQSNIFICSALIDMYSKCGNLAHANEVLTRTLVRDVGSWGALITAYAQHGEGKKVLQLATQMHEEGIRLNHIILISILSACSHAGLVNEGCYFFNSMHGDHGVKPTAKHYACMVDLLGRAGRLEDAFNLILKIPVHTSAPSWMALLSACRMYRDVEIATIAAERIHQLEPQNVAPFQLLHDICISSGQSLDLAGILHGCLIENWY